MMAAAERERLLAIAKANVERHLGDVVDAEADVSVAWDEAYILSLDALLDSDALAHGHEAVGDIAKEAASEYAAPLLPGDDE